MVIATTPFNFATSIQAAGFLDPEGLLKGFGGLALVAACVILFIECGLLIGVILPGDSLLFIVGMLIASNFITTQNFFEKHGSRAIVLARFVPIVRSVITGMAGVARMDFKTYATFSTIGGIVWVCSMTIAGYFLGSVPFVKENIDFVAIGIVLLSLIPVVFEVLRQRRLGKS